MDLFKNTIIKTGKNELINWQYSQNSIPTKENKRREKNLILKIYFFNCFYA